MLTVGVDLATVARKTAVCLIAWPDDHRAPASIEQILPAATDEVVLELAERAEVVAIDAPFGWPRPWADAVAGHRPGELFDASGEPASLTRRATDAWIADTLGIYPLAVAANLIGATAIRSARLVHRLGRSVDVGVRVEPPFVSEVYPAAALLRWGLSHRLYKGTRLAEPRRLLIDEVVRAGLPMTLSPAQRQVLDRSDDAFDAMICAVVARAIVLGLTDDAPEALRERAAVEGWIRVPSADVSMASIHNREKRADA